MRVFSRFVERSGLRAEFPVLERLAYLNAGTDGPLPARAVRAAGEELEREAEQGRTSAHFERRAELSGELRTLYAGVLGCETTDLALTTSTSEGLAQVIGGMELSKGDEIVTSDEEHPGLQGALLAARDLKGASIKAVPFAEVANAVSPKTRLVACSHVGWMSGSLAPAELTEVDIPVLLDGAQGVGAVPVDVAALGCDAYAGAGQKWLCGPDGTGMLYVSPALRERLQVARRGYANLADPNEGLAAQLHDDARRLDSQLLSAETLACALAATTLLASAGWETVHERARTLTARLAELLGEQGIAVAPRGESTLVSFESADPEAERARLAAGGVVLRDIPGRPWLRASVGTWNDEGDLERLLEMLPR
jgi:selenocysteine lyase/cysteine desulfurase